jgi:hypothetical protein
VLALTNVLIFASFEDLWHLRHNLKTTPAFELLEELGREHSLGTIQHSTNHYHMKLAALISSLLLLKRFQT